MGDEPSSGSNSRSFDEGSVKSPAYIGRMQQNVSLTTPSSDSSSPDGATGGRFRRFVPSPRFAGEKDVPKGPAPPTPEALKPIGFGNTPEADPKKRNSGWAKFRGMFPGKSDRSSQKGSEEDAWQVEEESQSGFLTTPKKPMLLGRMGFSRSGSAKLTDDY